MTQQAYCIIWIFFSLATTTTDDLDISSSTTTTSSSAATPCTTPDWAQQQQQQRQQHRDHLWPASMLINAVFGIAVTGRTNAQEEVGSSLSYFFRSNQVFFYNLMFFFRSDHLDRWRQRWSHLCPWGHVPLAGQPLPQERVGRGVLHVRRHHPHPQRARLRRALLQREVGRQRLVRQSRRQLHPKARSQWTDISG